MTALIVQYQVLMGHLCIYQSRRLIMADITYLIDDNHNPITGLDMIESKSITYI